MSTFKANYELTIESERYIIAPHPSAPKHPFAQTGRKGTVYQLRHKSQSNDRALKIFAEPFRDVCMVELTNTLACYAHLPGMDVCKRQVLVPNGFGKKAIAKHPELKFSVLMPWSVGRTWFDVIASFVDIVPEVCTDIARRMAFVLAGLEKEGIAHCDISSANVLVNEETLEVQLIDVEDIYSPLLPPPSAIPTGTDGYNHKQGRAEGQWNIYGDRFAGAVIISEMLCWYSQEFRDSATEDGTYFYPTEMQDKSSSKYALLLDTLLTLPTLSQLQARQLVDLFTLAWESKTLEECPPVSQWLAVLEKTRHVPTGTRLSAQSIAWQDPLLGWKDIKIGTPPATSPIRSFKGELTPLRNSNLRSPRIVPIPNPLGNGSYRVSWLAVAGAEVYELEEAQDSSFSSPNVVYRGKDTLIAVDRNTKGTYFYRVRAINSETSSAWSPPFSVSVWNP